MVASSSQLFVYLIIFPYKLLSQFSIPKATRELACGTPKRDTFFNQCHYIFFTIASKDSPKQKSRNKPQEE